MRTLFWISLNIILSGALKASTGITVKGTYIIDKDSHLKFNNLDWTKEKLIRPGERVKLGYNRNDAVWIKLKLKNVTNKRLKRIISFDNIYIDSLTLFEGDKQRILGDRTNQVCLYLTVFGYPIELDAGQKSVFYVRIKKGISFFEFSYDLEKEEVLIRKSQENTLTLSFFLGLVFLLFFISVILWYHSRKRIYILYLVYSFFTVVYILITSGFAKFYFFKNVLIFSELRIYFGTLWLLALVFFLDDFLELKEKQKLLHRWIERIGLLHLMVITSSLYFLYIWNGEVLKLFTITAYFLFLLLIFMIIAASFRHFRFDSAAAIYVLLAFSPLVLWAGVYIINAIGLIRYNPSLDWLTVAGLFEVFLFGFILTRNYIEAFRKENHLQKEMIRQRKEAYELVNMAQIRERSNIAHILHDKFGGSLSALKKQLSYNQSDKAMNLLNEISSDLRKLSHVVMPKALEEGALFDALQQQLMILNESISVLKIELFNYDFPEKLSLEKAQPLYLIILELVNNAIKHANSKTITVELFGYSDEIVIQIIDDGTGFNVENQIQGFGMKTIKSRLIEMQGEMVVESSKEDGTHVMLKTPL